MENPRVGSDGGTVIGPAVQVADICLPAAALPLRLVEWKVKPGSLVNVDSVLALCAPIQVDGAVRLPEKKVKSDRAGVVKELCCQLGQVLSPGGVIVKIEECCHPIVMKGLCAECGQDLTQLQSFSRNQQTPISTATVSMVHSVPELMVSTEQAEQLGREDQQRLHRNKKLVLMVDLDQTLIHTTEQHVQRISNKGIFHFQLGRGEPVLHTRLRPHCKEFLEKIAKLYELHVFTFGSRLYAHTIAGFLDPEKKLFSHRILSRDECIDPFSKTGNLRNLFPCGDSMVCIIDDREDVWKFAPNLITVKKYIYFQGTGDINAPPGSREAQAARKVSSTNAQPDSTEQTRTPSSDDQNNGLSKKDNDQDASAKEDLTSKCSQEESTAEHTPLTDDVEGQSLSSLGCEMDTGSLEMSVDGEQNNLKGDGKRRTRDTQDSAYSSTFSHEAANLDLDISSDSDSFSEKTTSKESAGEDKSSQTKFSEPGGDTSEPSDAVVAREGDDKAPIESKNSQDTAESSGVLLPDTDLGNGCQEKREPETESQISEQSGVTLVEELLDQSMEDDEDDEDTFNDQDDHLIYLEEVLERIHGEYYARYESYLKREVCDAPDIRKIVPELKRKTLEGTTLVFSGLYPTNYPLERTREHYHAKALGAKISKQLVLDSKDANSTTHLIAAKTGTEKVRQGQGLKHLHVVNPDWLWSCLERWERVEEQLFPLKEDYSKNIGNRCNSPAAFLEHQSSVKKSNFQSVPVQQSVPAQAPEVRHYDPVTGKLIRRAPQVSWPPAYPGSTSSSSMLSDHGENSFLRANKSQDDVTPSCQDNEQPGPSRRKRQLSMSETMPLYTLCKEDLESMDKEVDDILCEDSDNESEGQGKEKAVAEEGDDEDECPEAEGKSSRGLGPQSLNMEGSIQTTASEASLPSKTLRGCKRKHDEVKEEEDKKEDESADESSKESNEEEEGSSSEADEMAAALEAELNDFM
ncbi:RNA polymerase II subunit A C-terminal domain phosphatase [Synchiropus picturatus]